MPRKIRIDTPREYKQDRHKDKTIDLKSRPDTFATKLMIEDRYSSCNTPQPACIFESACRRNLTNYQKSQIVQQPY